MAEKTGSKVWPPPWPDITAVAVRRAIEKVPRHLFVPQEYRDRAYEDLPLPIGYQQTISQPYIVAVMLQALQLRADAQVLEIGTGSGYQTAVLAELTQRVFTVEALPELADSAQERFRALGIAVSCRVGDGRRGWREAAPFDGIVVSAAAPAIPAPLVAQLAPGGRLVIPVGSHSDEQWLWLVERRDRLYLRPLMAVRFVPLVATEELIPIDREEATEWARADRELRLAERERVDEA
jgi:protein-L-isoaspartate(D-aspartate) O-methyltransferase